jgi:hypothetical protein
VSSILHTDHVPAIEFLRLSQRVRPGAYGLGKVTLALSKTHNVGAWDERMLVGSVRVLTDGYFFATIPESFVDQHYRRRWYWSGTDAESLRSSAAWETCFWSAIRCCGVLRTDRLQA